MRVSKQLLVFATVAFCAVATSASALTLSLGIRETGAAGAIFSNGGSSGGIEWVNLDAAVNNIPVDGTWNQVTFNFQTDPLTAFAGATADSLYTGTSGTIEHIRILNSDGIATPIKFYVDDLVHTDASGASTAFGWEANAVGDEVMFQEPGFSGSTAANLVAGATAGVTNSMAHSGSQSYQADFQFVDGATNRWVRFTTFNAANSPNPLITFGQGDSVSFWAKATTIPEPTSVVMAGVAALGLIAVRRRK